MKNHGNRRMQGVILAEQTKAMIIEEGLEGKAHRFRVFRLDEDVCAKCRKPRKAHMREDRRR